MSPYGYSLTGRALPMCLLCGAMVGDEELHDKFHASIEKKADILWHDGGKAVKDGGIINESE
jgi:hypothetical protein